MYEKLNFDAIGTSSSAIAHSLGYEDGENIPFEEYLYIVTRISKNSNLPFTVDLEAGHGDTIDKIISNIVKLNKVGIVGINIEDSIIQNSIRIILDAEEFSKKLNLICKELEREKIEIFINVRTDTYLLNVENRLAETKKRIKHYESSKIDGIFIPCITQESDIKVF